MKYVQIIPTTPEARKALEEYAEEHSFQKAEVAILTPFGTYLQVSPHELPPETGETVYFESKGPLLKMLNSVHHDPATVRGPRS